MVTSSAENKFLRIDLREREDLKYLKDQAEDLRKYTSNDTWKNIYKNLENVLDELDALEKNIEVPN